MLPFSWLELGLQVLLLGLLAVAIPFAVRLERGLREIRKDRAAMEASAQGLSEAAGAAEAAILRLRAAAESAGRQVNDRIAAAEPLRDDLRFLVERAEGLADRLESGVRAGRPASGHGPQAPAPARPVPPTAEEANALRSQAERDLLRALSVGTGKGSR